MHQNIARPQQRSIGTFLDVDMQAQAPAKVHQLVSDYVVPRVDAQLVAAQHMVYRVVHHDPAAKARPKVQCVQRKPGAHACTQGPRTRPKVNRALLGADQGRDVCRSMRRAEYL